MTKMSQRHLYYFESASVAVDGAEKYEISNYGESYADVKYTCCETRSHSEHAINARDAN